MQLRGSVRLLREVAETASDAEWTSRPFPGANLIGFTVWHGARTIDWGVNFVLRRTPELVESDEWSDVMVGDGLFGAGAARETADRVAHAVPRARLVAYLDELEAQTQAWLGSVPSADLEATIDLRERQADKPEYLAPAVWQEIEDLDGIPAWQFLARPCISHIRVHYGEVTSQLEALRSA